MPVPENTQESDQYQWTTVTRSRRNRPTNNDFHQETKHQLKSTTTKRSSIKPQTEDTEDTETEEDYIWNKQQKTNKKKNSIGSN